MGLASHLIFRATDSRVLAPSPGGRRALAAAMARAAERHPLLAFGAADTHVHVLVLGPSATVGPTARALALAIRAATHPPGLEPTRIVDVVDQTHLGRAFTYVLGQATHHGVQSDPTLEGSAIHELLGARPLGGRLIARVREHLPRVDRAALLAVLGRRTLEPVLTLDHLVDAAAAAAAAPDLAGKSAPVVRARHAALGLARDRLGVAGAAAVVGIPARSARRLLETAPPPAWTRAVGLQMALRSPERPLA